MLALPGPRARLFARMAARRERQSGHLTVSPQERSRPWGPWFARGSRWTKQSWRPRGARRPRRTSLRSKRSGWSSWSGRTRRTSPGWPGWTRCSLSAGWSRIPWWSRLVHALLQLAENTEHVHARNEQFTRDRDIALKKPRVHGTLCEQPSASTTKNRQPVATGAGGPYAITVLALTEHARAGTLGFAKGARARASGGIVEASHCGSRARLGHARGHRAV